MKQTLYKPLITEKTLLLAARGWFTFAASQEVGKSEIAREIERLYGVHVIEVRTMVQHGKVRRVGRKMQTRTLRDWKKAMVKLKSGERIDAFEVTSDEKK